jgi:DNA-binding NarL/FixJ family response regulator
MRNKPPAAAPPAGIVLTPRERDLLALLSRGLDDKAIAAHLQLAHGSVRNRLTALYRKLGVTSRTAAALHAAARHSR